MKTSAQRVLAATNSWLHAQTRRSQYSLRQGPGLCLHASARWSSSPRTAHLFHVGDARIYRLVRQCTSSSSPRIIASAFRREQSYLGRALGRSIRSSRSTTARCRSSRAMSSCSRPTASTSTSAARVIAAAISDNARRSGRGGTAHRGGGLRAAAARTTSPSRSCASTSCPTVTPSEVFGQPTELPLPPLLEPGMIFDGYRIVRELHAQQPQPRLSRGRRASRCPGRDQDALDRSAQMIAAYLKRFMHGRVDRAAHRQPARAESRGCTRRKRNYLYVVTEYIEGQTLAQWMIDHPRPDLETVRGIVEQIAKGLRAFHRHGDAASGPAARQHHDRHDRHGEDHRLRLDAVAGIAEMRAPADRDDVLGTVQYTAPEYFLGEAGPPRSDLFSLGVIAYQMLSGRLPYGAQVPQARTRAAAAQADDTIRCSTTTAKSRHGSTRRSRRPCIPIRPSATRAVGIRLRSAPPQFQISRFCRDPPSRNVTRCCFGNARRSFWHALYWHCSPAGTASAG